MCDFLQKNLSIYNCNNVNIINSDFLDMKNLWADVVFLNPSYSNPTDKPLLDLFTDFSPDLVALMR